MTVSLAPAVELGDVELMVRVQADDPDAFGALYDRFGARAYRVAYAISRDGTRAEDIVQEAFLSVWRSRAAYQPQRGTVTGWVMGTVRNRAIDSFRRNGPHDSRRAGEDHIDERLQLPEASRRRPANVTRPHGCAACSGSSPPPSARRSLSPTSVS